MDRDNSNQYDSHQENSDWENSDQYDSNQDISFLHRLMDSDVPVFENLQKRKPKYRENPKQGAENTMVTKDWYMRQVEMMIQFLAKVIFRKETIQYDISDILNKTVYDLLHEQLLELLKEGNIDQAENLLFDRLEEGNVSCFHVAVDFYLRLNQLSDVELDTLGFSREEIDAGLKDAAKIYGAELF